MTKTGIDLTTKKAKKEDSPIYNEQHIEFINDRLGITTKMEQRREVELQRETEGARIHLRRQEQQVQDQGSSDYIH